MLQPTLVRYRDRHYVPADFRVVDWAGLEPFYRELMERPILGLDDLEAWLRDRSELEAITVEDARWRFIQTTRDTASEDHAEAFRRFAVDIKPELVRREQALDRKFLECPYTELLPKQQFFPYLRKLQQRLELFREENVALQAEHQVLQKEYDRISGKLSVELDGKVYTMQQASLALTDPDRSLREAMYLRLANRRLEEKLAYDELYDQLLFQRHQMAVNAGFDHFRDYQFANLGRFDYSPEDCYAFHDAIEAEVMPLVQFLDLRKATLLDLDQLRPWDDRIGCTGRYPGQPFADAADMLDKSIQALYRVDPLFGDTLSTMRRRDYLDLESRMGKAPGGYNCTLPESGVPFIFMNASGSTRDVKTITHEAGHAVHAVLSRDLPYTGLKEPPSEIAELAAMGMEYFCFDHWDLFWPDPEKQTLARIEHLERVVNLFPWVAMIDAFQHWVYTHPGHSIAEREQAWLDLHARFGSREIDWTDYEHYKVFQWQGQMHLFKVPFYYIEYAMAQLGAIALWRNHQADPAGTLKQYKDALALGYTKPIAETYATAGIRFDFSRGYVRELMGFVKAELERLFAEL